MQTGSHDGSYRRSTMLTTPFLTQIDSRAAIKGSRDPLGVQAIWARMGRSVVTNLTTVSNSARDFTVLILGYYFAERVADGGGTAGELVTFLKWEQLAGYARAHVNKERGFRGTERVAQRLSDGSRVRLGMDSGAQILSNQKIYGLWGLYTVPARASGLIQGDPSRLTEDTRVVVERSLIPVLESAGPRTVQRILDKLSVPDATLEVSDGSRDAAMLKGIGRALQPLRAAERKLYREHLLYGGNADRESSRGTLGRQRVFADLLTETLDEDDWEITAESLRALAMRAPGRGASGLELAQQLERICAAELLLAPAVALFEYALSCDGRSPATIAQDLAQHWGKVFRSTIDLEVVAGLEPDLRAGLGDEDTGERWKAVAAALYAAQYQEALHLLIAQNGAVMKARSAAAPWAVIRDDKLTVRLHDEQRGSLPAAGSVPTYWRHAYFIDSLRRVAADLRSPT
jgi:hypothetical protein